MAGGRAFICDNGGTFRRVRRFFLRDFNGVPRRAKRVFVRDATGVPRLVFEGYIFDGTVVPSEFNPGSQPSYGYQLGLDGSISGNGLTTDGETIRQLIDSYSYVSDPATVASYLQITGFTSDPGQFYFTELLVGGTAFTTASATGYGFTSGTASWSWAGPFGLNFNQAITVQIVP